LVLCKTQNLSLHSNHTLTPPSPQFSSIITLRIIMIIAAQILSAAGDFYAVQNCSKLLDVIGDAATLVEQYPSCSSLIDSNNLKAVAAVNANFGGSAVELMSAMNLSFGMAGWLATSLHAIGVEVYVSSLYSGGLLSSVLSVAANVTTIAAPHSQRIRAPPSGFLSATDGSWVQERWACGACREAFFG
jgi:hypothetical protein